MVSAWLEKVAVIAPQYFPQGDQLFGGRVAGSLFDLAECACADGDALQLQLCYHVHVPQAFLLPQAAYVKQENEQLQKENQKLKKALSKQDKNIIRNL